MDACRWHGIMPHQNETEKPHLATLYAISSHSRRVGSRMQEAAIFLRGDLVCVVSACRHFLTRKCIHLPLFVGTRVSENVR